MVDSFLGLVMCFQDFLDLELDCSKFLEAECRQACSDVLATLGREDLERLD